ncbi:pG1 protein [Ureaplasma urealyticum serovar 5 str. ATCC 27817]|nr:pG1 protein [Ureaplasma urealyticum serovar 5 str. ATCC 27817]
MYYRGCWHIVSRYLFKWYSQTKIISYLSVSSHIKELYNL